MQAVTRRALDSRPCHPLAIREGRILCPGPELKLFSFEQPAGPGSYHSGLRFVPLFGVSLGAVNRIGGYPVPCDEGRGLGRKQMAETTCNQCDARYNSERELRDHLGAAHRQFSSEQSQSSSEPADTRSEASAAPVNEPAK